MTIVSHEAKKHAGCMRQMSESFTRYSTTLDLELVYISYHESYCLVIKDVLSI